MKKIRLIFTLVLIACFALFAGCKDTPVNPNPDPDNVDWDSKEVLDVSPVQETFNKEYEYDEFTLDLLKIHIEYTDGTTRDISITEEMLSDEDLAKLTRIGKPRIEVVYNDEFSFKAVVTLVDSSRLDENLNADGKYAAVIKAIRDKEKGVINFYLDSNTNYNVCAFAFAFQFDASIMQVSNALVNDKLAGEGGVLLDGNKIIFAYSENGKVISESVLLFSVSYTGDYRESKLALCEDYNNILYVADLETFDTHVVNNVLYHVSVK